MKYSEKMVKISHVFVAIWCRWSPIIYFRYIYSVQLTMNHWSHINPKISHHGCLPGGLIQIPDNILFLTQSSGADENSYGSDVIAKYYCILIWFTDHVAMVYDYCRNVHELCIVAINWGGNS